MQALLQGEPEERDNSTMTLPQSFLRYQLVVHLYQCHRAEHNKKRHQQNNLPTKHDEARSVIERNKVRDILKLLPKPKKTKGGEDR